MSENICYLCQEPKSVVGHNTQTCPSVKCKKCGQKGHIIRNCSNFNSNMDQKSKSSDTVEPKMSNENDETKTLDLKAKTNRINSDEFLFYANPKINLGYQKLKASTDRINSDCGCSKEIKSEKSVDWILVKILGCTIISKPKFDVKEILKNKMYGIDQRPDIVDPRISINKENMDSIHNIEISNDIKSKLDVEQEPMDLYLQGF